MKKITAAEIAKIAHVSPATVSRALNHRSSVNNDTLKLIDEAMEKLNYKKKKNEGTSTFILNVCDLSNIFYADVIKGVNAAAQAKNFKVIIDQTILNDTTIDEFITFIEKFHIYGLITLHQLSTKILKKLSKVIKVVQCCEYNEDSQLPCVSIDDYEAACKATNYLINSDRKKLCLINSGIENAYAYKRQLGFIDTVNNNGLKLQQDLIITLSAINYDIAYPIIDQLFSSSNRPDAIFCVSDTIAAAVINVAAKYHVKIPNDLAVIGFDNTIIAKLTTPAVTTINVPRFQEGYTAVDLLTTNYHLEQKIFLKTELVIRESI